jgi:hypothetical protein
LWQVVVQVLLKALVTQVVEEVQEDLDILLILFQLLVVPLNP